MPKHFKIIHTCNFGGDYPDEKFVTELPLMTEVDATGICAAINATLEENHPRFYRVVPENYELVPGFQA